MSQAGAVSSSGGGGGGITTINGDVGSVTGSIISLLANTGSASNGASVSFTAASATEMDLVLVSAAGNMFVGSGSGVPDANIPAGGSNTGIGQFTLASLSGGGVSNNTALGYGAGYGITSGQQNTVIGWEALTNGFTPAITGSYNIVIGGLSGSNYTGAESSNVLLCSDGVVGESNIIRIGRQGAGAQQQSACYIAGINNSDSSGFTSPLAVYVDSSTGQLGYGSGGGGGIVTLDGNTGSATGSTVTIDATQSSAQFTGSGSTLTLAFTSGTGNLSIGTGSPTTFASINNTGFGNRSFQVLTTGGNNTCIGALSSNNLRDGSFNTFVGYECGTNMVHGNYNIALGQTAGSNLGGGGSDSSNIDIGNPGVTGDNNIIRIGTQGTGSGQQNTCFIAGISGATPITGKVVGVASTGQLTGGGILTNPAQPAFLVAVETAQPNVTGNGVLYNVLFDTKIFDQSSNIILNSGGVTYFQAPVTGLYQFNVNLLAGNALSALVTSCDAYIYNFTSGIKYYFGFINPGVAQASGGFITLTGSCLINLAASDFVNIAIIMGGGTQTVSLYGAASPNIFTTWSGNLVC